MPLRVLFLQSQSYFGADSEIHAQLMRYYEPDEVIVHVACNPAKEQNPEVSTIHHLKSIPSIHLRETDFGYSRKGLPNYTKAFTLFGRVLKLLFSLASYIRKNKIQIIHCTEKPRDAFYGVLLAKITGAKCVIHMHVNYGEWLNPEVKWALHQADAIIGVSDFTAQSIVNRGYSSERAYSVLNSLALTSSRWNIVRDGNPVRADLNIPDTTPVLGVVSRLFNWKGHLDLLEAMAIVRNEFPNVKLVIVGEDDPRANANGGSFKEELKAKIQELGLEDNVHFTGFRTDIPELMAAFDIYTMPSWEEPFGMVYVEAMASKKPVVAWNMAGPSQIVVDGETGFLVEPKNITALAESICKLIRNPILRQKFGDAARKRVENEFTSKRLCQDVKAVYEKILSR